MDAPERPASLVVHPSTRAIAEFGPFRLDLGNRLLYRGDRQVPLPPRALAVLIYLVERPNQVVAKQALMDNVWKDTFVEEASLKEAVSLVRQALEEDAQAPQFIQTMHRRGYRFVAPVSLTTAFSGDGRAGSGAAGQSNDARLPRAARPPTRSLRVRALMTATVLALAVFAAGTLWTVGRSDSVGASRVVRFEIPVEHPGESTLPALAISRDGSRIVFVAKKGGTERLYERRLDEVDSRELPDTDDAAEPFVSPDGKWIGFFAHDRLKKVSVDGGAPLVVCPAYDGAGGTWTADGTIVFGGANGLVRVPASGGDPASVTRIDAGRGEVGHWWPHALPDGDTIVFTIWRTGLDRASLAVVSLKSGVQHVLFDGAADARYLPSGHLLFARSGGAATVRFDTVRLRVVGSPRPVPLDAAIAPFSGVLHADVADDGSIVYTPGSAATPTFVPAWVDVVTQLGTPLDGAIDPLPFAPRPYRNLKLSPDGRRIAATINEASDYDVWVGDIDRGTLSRLTFGGRNIEPVWSSDGQWVMYAASVSTPFAMMRRRADGSGSAERLLMGDRPYFPWASSPDGHVVIVGEDHRQTGLGLSVLTVGQRDRLVPLTESPFEEFSAAFSPDGRAVAYVSTESGRDDVYVRPYPGDGRWQVSTSGGNKPFWSADGRRLFYSVDDALMAADVRWSVEPTIGRPEKVLERPGMTWFAAGRDGRILALQSQAPPPVRSSLRVVLNWLDSIRDRLAPAS